MSDLAILSVHAPAVPWRTPTCHVRSRLELLGKHFQVYAMQGPIEEEYIAITSYRVDSRLIRLKIELTSIVTASSRMTLGLK